jgi:hypothetical protein
MVFDPDTPPSERDGFLSWFFRTIRLQDGHLTVNPSIAAPALLDWYRDMKVAYPPVAGPDAPEIADRDDTSRTDYRFADTAVFARFDWDVSRQAYRRAMKLAHLHNVGFFDVSGEQAWVWMPAPGDRFIVAHCGDKVILNA